jgi:hypothetical protein
MEKEWTGIKAWCEKTIEGETWVCLHEIRTTDTETQHRVTKKCLEYEEEVVEECF